MGRPKKEQKDKFDQEIFELAMMTRNWARQTGCFIPEGEEDERKHGYFTVEEWCERFERTKADWRYVKRKMISNGDPLTVDDFGGHYLGTPGAQAKNVTTLFVRSITMLGTSMELLGAMQGTKDWEKVLEVAKDILSQSRYHFNLDEIPALLAGAGHKVPDKIRQALLSSGE